jgi:crossover junction endodeoxyribonuclease RuvC
VRVLGIDPALRVTGYGVIETRGARTVLVEAGVISPNVDAPLETRLRDLHAGVVDVLNATRPDVVAIEELYTTYKNPLTAILMGHARGVMCLASAQAGLAVHTLGHSRVKRALVGSGSARKEQINSMVMHLLNLKKAPKPNDVSDALAIALAYLNMASHAPVIPSEARSAKSRDRR